MKKVFGVIIMLALIGVGMYYLGASSTKTEVTNDTETENQATTTEDTTEEEVVVDETKTVIGQSVDGTDITAYHYGEGDDEVVFIGGLHGGYAWNTTLLMYELMDRFELDAPEDLKITIIPALNPDGLESVVGTTERFEETDVDTSAEVQVAGRFNSNNVDLNRNFDCDWSAEATWRNQTVSGGSSAFSEPESKALRDYIEDANPKAVVVWDTSAGGVYSSSCDGESLSETSTILNLYADATGYTANEDFDAYVITGDLTNWLAKVGVPAISVLLTSDDEIELSKNIRGVDALIGYFTEDNE